jgi:hypothetical protein
MKQGQLFLISTLDSSEQKASQPGHFTPGERGPVPRGIGGWLGRRVGIKTLEKRKYPHP